MGRTAKGKKRMYEKFEATKEYGFGEVWHLRGGIALDKSVPQGKQMKEAMKWFSRKIAKTLLGNRMVEVGKNETEDSTSYHFHFVVIEPSGDGWMSSESPEALEMAALCKKKKGKDE